MLLLAVFYNLEKVNRKSSLQSVIVRVLRKLKDLGSNRASSWLSIAAGRKVWLSLRVTPRTRALCGAHSGLEPPRTPACAHNHIKRQQRSGRPESSGFHMDPSSPQPAFVLAVVTAATDDYCREVLKERRSGPAMQAYSDAVTAMRCVRRKDGLCKNSGL